MSTCSKNKCVNLTGEFNAQTANILNLQTDLLIDISILTNKLLTSLIRNLPCININYY